MTDPNSPEAVAQRASPPDPIVMYLIVREAIGMSVGKTAAQVGHATQMLTLKYFELKHEPFSTNFGVPDTIDPTGIRIADQDAIRKLDIMKQWLNSSFRKVVLCADEKEWVRLKSESPDVIVVDCGLTELAPHTETVIGFWPMRKSQAPKIIKRLQVLK